MSGDIIPELGQWVYCKGIYCSAGKVEKINFDRSQIIACFLVEPGKDGRFEIESSPVNFCDIESIVSDPKEIEQLEGELSGKIVLDD
jgi:hypothetical protein